MSNYNRKDHLHQKAKAEGYRSRAAYKLSEIQKKFKIMKKGGFVVDLGSWPGGWLQVASESVGATGVVIGVDLVEIDSLPESNIHFLKGDVSNPEIQRFIKEKSGEKGADAVISDMSQKLSGIRDQDVMGSVRCGELALSTSFSILKVNGSLVMKLFPGQEIEEFIKQKVKPAFAQVSRTELDASRSTSKEFYVVARGFKG